MRSLVLLFIESLLKLYPPRFRHEFYSEIRKVILSRLDEAQLRGQWSCAVFQEIAGLVPSIIQERWHELKFRKEIIMIIANEKPRWFFYLGWVVLNVIAVILGWFIAWALISQITKIVGGTIQVNGQSHITEDFLLSYVLFPIIGLLMGFFQYTLLQRYLSHMAWWIAATFLGWLMVFATGFLILTILERRNDTLSIVFGMLLIGATIAVPQWWMLRKRVRYASWWILAYGLSWSVIGLLNLVTSEPVPILLAFALIPGIATGFACWLLLDWLPGRELKKNIPGY